MPTSPGRSTEPRTVASVVTNATTAITFPSGAITTSDIGRPISGTGIPAGATLAARPSATTGTLSAAASGSATITATLGADRATGYGYGFLGWVPETDAEAALYPLPTAGAGAPSILADAVTRVPQRNR